jgi:ubiquinone/menaquinone biosynthesis C-methylase UbiE
MVENSFTKIWENFLEADNIGKLISDHIRGREPLLELLSKYIHSVTKLNTNNKIVRILEVGCGTGIDSHVLSTRFVKENVSFVATDISEKAIEVAKKISGQFIGKVTLLVDDASSMHFRDSYFDIIFSQGVLEHFKDPKPVLCEQKRVLKESGYIVVDVPQKFNPYTYYKHFCLKRKIWPYGWETELFPCDLKKLGAKLGLKIVEFSAYGDGIDFLFSPWKDIMKRSRLIHLFLSLTYRILHYSIYGAAKIFGRYKHYFLQNIIVVYRKDDN